jgi:hypothetical protein
LAALIKSRQTKREPGTEVKRTLLEIGNVGAAERNANAVLGSLLDTFLLDNRGRLGIQNQQKS